MATSPSFLDNLSYHPHRPIDFTSKPKDTAQSAISVIDVVDVKATGIDRARLERVGQRSFAMKLRRELVSQQVKGEAKQSVGLGHSRRIRSRFRDHLKALSQRQRTAEVP